MDNRLFPALNRTVSVVGAGTWQLGVDRRQVDDASAARTLEAACRAGVDIVDTADVYGHGDSERFVGRFLEQHPDADILVATKTGRRLPPSPENYSRDNLLAWNDRSRENLGVETIDLVQLHCPTDDMLRTPGVWDVLDEMVAEKRIRTYGVSAETCAQALEAMARPGCSSVELIVNVFRHKPLEEVLPTARETGTAVLARVPLPEGMLSRNHRKATETALPTAVASLDVGWIFSVVPQDVGVLAAREFAGLCRELVPERVHPFQVGLRWVLDQPGVTCILPELLGPHQVESAVRAAELLPLGADVHAAFADLYDRLLRRYVHPHW